MADRQATLKGIGITPFIVLSYGAYYLVGTGSERFETVGYGLLCSSVLALIFSALLWRSLRPAERAFAIGPWLRARPAVLLEHSPAIIFAVSLVIYVWAETRMGFLLATSGAVLWFLIYLRAGSPLRITLLGVVLTGLAWLILLQLLNVPLPSSPWTQ